MAGTIVLMLFARQSIAPAWIACDGVGSPAATAADTAMQHLDHGASHGMPSQSPAPRRGSGCDHSSADNSCCAGLGCAPAVVGAPILAVAPSPIQPLAIPASAGRFLSPAFAPDIPPPRV